MIFSIVVFPLGVWAANTASCPNGFENLGDECIHYDLKNKVNWAEAVEICTSKNAILIPMHDEETENRTIEFLTSKGISDEFWVERPIDL